VNIGVNVKTLNKDGGYVWYVYTDQGYRRDGDWTRTGAMWMKGTCIIEVSERSERALMKTRAINPAK